MIQKRINVKMTFTKSLNQSELGMWHHFSKMNSVAHDDNQLT